MQIAKVMGTRTTTVKHPSLKGQRLLIVQPYAVDGRTPDGEPLIAVDSVGAGRGEMVMISNDSKSTRALVGDNNTPIRWNIIGIQD